MNEASEVVEIAGVGVLLETSGGLHRVAMLAPAGEVRAYPDRGSGDPVADVLAAIAAPPLQPCPDEVPMWALRAVLDLEGLSPQIDAIIAAAPQPERTIADRVWNYGNYIARNSPTLAAIATQLAKSQLDIDGYFRAAVALKP